MTVTTDDNRQSFSGNDSATEFALTLKTLAATDLIGYLVSGGVATALTKDVHWSVVLNGDQEASPGGTITYPLAGDPLPTGDSLLFIRDLSLVQESDLSNQGGALAEVVETELDRSRMIDQQLQEQIDRALTLAVNSEGVSAVLPSPTAGYLIAWNATADALASIAPGSSVIYVGTTSPDESVFPLWYNTSDNTLNYWDGAAWASVPVGVSATSTSTLTNKTIDDVTNVIGADHVHVKIKANEDLAVGDVVKGVGYNPGHDAIEVVKTTSTADVAFAVIDEAITNGDFGLGTNTGISENLDTSAFSVGDILYSDGAGGFTATRPTTGSYQTCGFVLRSHALNGRIFTEFTEPNEGLATQGEMEAGTEAAPRKMSPLRVAQAIAALAPSPAANIEAWLNFDGTAATPAPIADHNIDTITDNGTGDYTFNFTTALSHANYAVIGSSVANNSPSNNSPGIIALHGSWAGGATTKTVNACRVVGCVGNGTPTYDFADISIAFVL